MKECIAHSTKLIQAVADVLFNVPSSEDASGPIVSLPPPTTKLPREKPVCCLSCPLSLRQFSLRLLFVT